VTLALGQRRPHMTILSIVRHASECVSSSPANLSMPRHAVPPRQQKAPYFLRCFRAQLATSGRCREPTAIAAVSLPPDHAAMPRVVQPPGRCAAQYYGRLRIHADGDASLRMDATRPRRTAARRLRPSKALLRSLPFPSITRRPCLW
jgi:hypothetical protein